MIKNKRQNVIFMIIIFLLLIFQYAFFITGKKDIYVLENRYTEDLVMPKVQNVLNHSFQDSLEKYLADQYLGNETMKKTKLLFDSNLATPLFNNFLKTSSCENDYLLVNSSHKYYYYNCEPYYVAKANITEENYNTIKTKIENYNQLSSDVNVYYFIVNSSASVNFNENDDTKLYTFIKEQAKANGVEKLDIANFDEYKKYFYQTDHHWNDTGAYEGYKKIQKMMFPDEEPIKNIEKVCIDGFENIYGSLAKTMGYFNISEPFCVNKYDHIQYEQVFINDKESNFDFQTQYFNHTLEKKFGQNHYGIFHGSDYPKLVIKNNNQKERKLLLISNSMGNAVRLLLAQHVSELHEVDLRHYQNYYGTPFYIEEYIEENGITDVLYLGEITFFELDNFLNHYKEGK